MAFAAHESVLRPYYQCLVANNRTYTSCLMASGCDRSAISRCQTAVDDANRRCLIILSIESYMASLLMCTGGPSSACPEGDSDRTGPSVFTVQPCERGMTLLGLVLSFVGRRTARIVGRLLHRTYLFETSGSDFNTVVYLLRTVGRGVACNDNFADLTSQVEVTLEEGESVIVVVDGYDEESAGDYVVNVYRG